MLELARLYQTFVAVGDSALHSTVMQLLLLQKLCKQSKAKDHSYHLSRRLDLWKKGSVDELLKEFCCIQNHLKSTHPGSDKSYMGCCSPLLFENKVAVVICLLTAAHKGGVLLLNSLVPSGSGASGMQSIVQSH